MPLSDIDARRAESAATWQTCATCALLHALPDKEAAVLVDLLSDVTVRYSWLADELHREGHAIDWQALSRHARGRCAAKAKLR